MWRDDLLDFAKQFDHPAWGLSHSMRIHRLAMDLAGQEGFELDDDALYAAALIHDMGAFEPYRLPDMDHAERSVQLAAEILEDHGVPEDKTPMIQTIIAGHMFYTEPGTEYEAIIFHDADVLDFMGRIGIARILSIVGTSDWTPDLASAIALLDRFRYELPEKLITPTAKKIGIDRQTEMTEFLTGLIRQTYGLETL